MTRTLLSSVSLSCMLFAALAATGAADDSSLPPPEIRGGRTGTTATPTTTPTTTTTTTTTSVPRAYVTPATSTPAVVVTNRGATSVTPVVRTTTTAPARVVYYQPPPPSVPPPPPPTPRAPSTVAYAAPAVGGNAIQEIRKNHNLPTSDGNMALRMDVLFAARGQAGQDVYLAGWFTDRRTGQLVASTRTAYADASGRLTVQTQATRVTTDAGSYWASLWVPYAAFPQADGGAAYEVEAKVQMLRREAGGLVTVLCEGTTTFTVYGK